MQNAPAELMIGRGIADLYIFVDPRMPGIWQACRRPRICFSLPLLLRFRLGPNSVPDGAESFTPDLK
jgi:hypothetical protein